MPLTMILQAMLEELKKYPGFPSKRFLSRGLEVVIVWDGKGYDLILTRALKGPAESEMKVVMRHWPWDIYSSRLDVRPGKYGGQDALQVRIPRRLP